MRSMTKSAVRLAREALTIGRAALPRYASRFSRHDFTQPQLFALLTLRQFLRTDYRGLVGGWRSGVSCAARWGSGKCRTTRRSATPNAGSSPTPKRGTFRRAQRAVVARATRAGLLDRAPVAAVEATGLETRHVSLYYRVRRGMAQTPAHRRRSWSKLTVVVHTRSHLILGAVTGTGPTQDSPEFTPALRQAAELLHFDTVLGDAGYDAEHNHRLCREELGVRDTVIALNPRNSGRPFSASSRTT
jgi:hypothetical protein